MKESKSVSSGLGGLAIFAVGILFNLFVCSHVHASTVVFSEDFESYAHGSMLSGQGGWVSDNATIVDNGFGLSSNVANGRIDPGHNDYSRSTNLFSDPLDSKYIYALTFDAYSYSASPTSHGSGVGFLHDDNHWAASWGVFGNEGGWALDLRFITDNMDNWILFNGGLDDVANFSITVDPRNLLVFGTAEFVSGATWESDIYGISIENFNEISGVMLAQDYRGGSGGAEFDNITVTAKAVPIPATILLLGAGLAGLAETRRRLKKIA